MDSIGYRLRVLHGTGYESLGFDPDSGHGACVTMNVSV